MQRNNPYSHIGRLRQHSAELNLQVRGVLAMTQPEHQQFLMHRMIAWCDRNYPRELPRLADVQDTFTKWFLLQWYYRDRQFLRQVNEEVLFYQPILRDLYRAYHSTAQLDQLRPQPCILSNSSKR
jgi:hypothetical protein